MMLLGSLSATTGEARSRCHYQRYAMIAGDFAPFLSIRSPRECASQATLQADALQHADVRFASISICVAMAAWSIHLTATRARRGDVRAGTAIWRRMTSILLNQRRSLPTINFSAHHQYWSATSIQPPPLGLWHYRLLGRVTIDRCRAITAADSL